MIDMAQFANTTLAKMAAAQVGAQYIPTKRHRPDYVCGECGSTDVDKDDISICNEKDCGKQSDFDYVLLWCIQDGEYEMARAKRCGHESHPDDVIHEPMAWYCRACGHVGEPRDLDRERWELAVGL